MLHMLVVAGKHQHQANIHGAEAKTTLARANTTNPAMT
jgi:hypothetical protein